MRSIRTSALGLLIALQLLAVNVKADDALRPEVGKPLIAAQELMRSQRFKEALAKVKEAEAVPGRTAYETYIVERMRGAAASGAGDADTAAAAFEAMASSGRMSADERARMEEAIAGSYYRAKDYAKALAWAQRYAKDGGSRPQVRDLAIQAQYLLGDYAGAAKELGALSAADETAGRAPSEDHLQLLANCNLKLKDFSGYAATLERLVTHYPKKEYWADLISRIQRKPGFSDRLALDVFRLQHATGNLHEAADYVEMAQLALQAGLPAEAKKIVDEGYARNALGKGAEAERHKRLRDMANRQAAEDQKQLARNETQAELAADGTALAGVGVAYAAQGQTEKGIALMEKGIAKGRLKRLDEVRLHLGEVYLRSGDKAAAHRVLRAVQGSDGTGDLARLWLIHGR
jgi:outer membrane protein assembly factor BamD (BamD/ComL family)